MRRKKKRKKQRGKKNKTGALFGKMQKTRELGIKGGGKDWMSRRRFQRSTGCSKKKRSQSEGGTRGRKTE